MPSFTQSTIALALALLFTGVKCDPTPIVPYLDTQCMKPITDITSDGVEVSTEYEFANDQGFPAYSALNNLKFGGAENKDKPGYTVYWQVGDIDLGCSVALMLGYSQQYYGFLPEVLPPGNVIMATNQPGCFYSFIPENAFLSSTFCCGQDDCEALSPGYSALYKRDLQETEKTSGTTEDVYSEGEGEKKPKRVHQRQHKFSSEPETGETSSTLIPKRDNSNDFDTSKCTVTLNEPRPEAGKQSLVANPNVCSSGTCSFAISHGVTVSTTFSTSSETTITNSAGASLSIHAGIDFIVNTDVTATAMYTFAKSVAKLTSTAITNSTTVTVTNELGQQEGTTAFATFTPTYLCWVPKISCGGDQDAYMDYCVPQFEADGQTLQGDYTVVYTA